jgi:chitinase
MVRTRTLSVGAVVAMAALVLAAVVYVARPAAQARAAGFQTVAYYDQWGIYGNAYYLKNVDREGIASKLTTMIYDFENIDPTNLTCFEAIKASDAGNEQDPNAGDGAEDAFADYQKSFDSSISVDGSSDTFSQPLKGNFHQLQELKARHPNLNVLLSLGGWTYSKYFSDASATAASRQKLVSSCIDMFIKGNLPTGIGGDPSGGPGVAAGIFDGFDIDWEYPGVLGHVGNHVSPSDMQNFTLLLKEFRTQLDALGAANGKHYLLTAALSAGQDKIAHIQTNQVGQYLDFGDVMTYDMHGAWEASGPTNFQAPLHDSPADPSAPIPPGNEKYNVDTAIRAWTSGLPDYGIPGGFPAGKINLGMPFYARGWSGVATGATNGLHQPASGPSPAFPFTQTAGVVDYKELVTAGLVNSSDLFFDGPTQSAWIYSGSTFYTLDTPQTIGIKDQYIRSSGLGGAFVFSLMGDDPSSTLLNAMVSGLQGGGPPPTPTPSTRPSSTPSTQPSPTPRHSPTPTPRHSPTPTPRHSPTPTPTHSPTPTPTTTPPPGGNLVSNGGFESGALSPWTCSPLGSVVSSPVHGGAHALAAAASSSDDAQCSQTISVQPGHAYTLSAWVQGNYPFIGVTGTGTGDPSTFTPASGGWTQLSVPFTTAAGTTSVTVYVHGWYAQGTVYADDFSVS